MVNKFKVGDKVAVVRIIKDLDDGHIYLFKKGFVVKVYKDGQNPHGREFDYDVKLEGLQTTRDDEDVISFYEEELIYYSRKSLKAAKVLYGGL